MAIIIYGIPNCDTISKTLKWFTDKGADYEFHNYKKQGVSKEQLKSWISQVGIEVIVNKKSSTWRMLADAEKLAFATVATAIPLIIHNPSILKRPIIERDGTIVAVGFEAAVKITMTQ